MAIAVVAAIILIGFGAKMFVFRDGEPVLANYALTAALLAVAGGIVIAQSRLIVIDRTAAVLLLLAIFWAGWSSLMSTISLNLIAAATFTATAIGFGFLVPALCMLLGWDTWRVLLWPLAICTVGSLLLYGIQPGNAIDEESGRFAGLFVSVAIACSMFGLQAFLAMKAGFEARKWPVAAAWFGLSALGFILLYLTRTRSSLVELMVGILLILWFAPMKRGLRIFTLSVSIIILLFSVVSLGAASTGIVQVDDQLREFRLEDSSLTASRGDNWDFGIERIRARPLFGEGLLAKQTSGGTAEVNFSGPTSYDPRYDPHSLMLSLGVEGGIPFMIFMLSLFGWVIVRFVYAFGWRAALASPEFVLVSLRVATSLFSGGDMTTMGNIIEKIVWMLLGTLMLKAEMKLRSTGKAGFIPAQPRLLIPSR